MNLKSLKPLNINGSTLIAPYASGPNPSNLVIPNQGPMGVSTRQIPPSSPNPNIFWWLFLRFNLYLTISSYNHDYSYKDFSYYALANISSNEDSPNRHSIPQLTQLTHQTPSKFVPSLPVLHHMYLF